MSINKYKYLKYKTKYLNLKQIGGNRISIKRMINSNKEGYWQYKNSKNEWINMGTNNNEILEKNYKDTPTILPDYKIHDLKTNNPYLTQNFKPKFSTTEIDFNIPSEINNYPLFADTNEKKKKILDFYYNYSMNLPLNKLKPTKNLSLNPINSYLLVGDSFNNEYKPYLYLFFDSIIGENVGNQTNYTIKFFYNKENPHNICDLYNEDIEDNEFIDNLKSLLDNHITLFNVPTSLFIKDRYKPDIYSDKQERERLLDFIFSDIKSTNPIILKLKEIIYIYYNENLNFIDEFSYNKIKDYYVIKNSSILKDVSDFKLQIYNNNNLKYFQIEFSDYFIEIQKHFKDYINKEQLINIIDKLEKEEINHTFLQNFIDYFKGYNYNKNNGIIELILPVGITNLKKYDNTYNKIYTNENTDGHAIALYIRNEKTATTNIYEVYLINSGAGSSIQRKMIENEFWLVPLYKKFDKKSEFYEFLMKILYHQKMITSVQDYNNYINFISKEMNFEQYYNTDTEYYKYKPQESGSCTFYSIYNLILFRYFEYLKKKKLTSTSINIQERINNFKNNIKKSGIFMFFNYISSLNSVKFNDKLIDIISKMKYIYNNILDDSYPEKLKIKDEIFESINTKLIENIKNKNKLNSNIIDNFINLNTSLKYQINLVPQYNEKETFIEILKSNIIEPNKTFDDIITKVFKLLKHIHDNEITFKFKYNKYNNLFIKNLINSIVINQLNILLKLEIPTTNVKEILLNIIKIINDLDKYFADFNYFDTKYLFPSGLHSTNEYFNPGIYPKMTFIILLLKIINKNNILQPKMNKYLDKNKIFNIFYFENNISIFTETDLELFYNYSGYLFIEENMEKKDLEEIITNMPFNNKYYTINFKSEKKDKIDKDNLTYEEVNIEKYYPEYYKLYEDTDSEYKEILVNLFSNIWKNKYIVGTEKQRYSYSSPLRKKKINFNYIFNKNTIDIPAKLDKMNILKSDDLDIIYKDYNFMKTGTNVNRNNNNILEVLDLIINNKDLSDIEEILSETLLINLSNIFYLEGSIDNNIFDLGTNQINYSFNHKYYLDKLQTINIRKNIQNKYNFTIIFLIFSFILFYSKETVSSNVSMFLNMFDFKELKKQHSNLFIFDFLYELQHILNTGKFNNIELLNPINYNLEELNFLDKKIFNIFSVGFFKHINLNCKIELLQTFIISEKNIFLNFIDNKPIINEQYEIIVEDNYVIRLYNYLNNNEYKYNNNKYDKDDQDKQNKYSKNKTSLYTDFLFNKSFLKIQKTNKNIIFDKDIETKLKNYNITFSAKNSNFKLDDLLNGKKFDIELIYKTENYILDNLNNYVYKNETGQISKRIIILNKNLDILILNLNDNIILNNSILYFNNIQYNLVVNNENLLLLNFINNHIFLLEKDNQYYIFYNTNYSNLEKDEIFKHKNGSYNFEKVKDENIYNIIKISNNYLELLIKNDNNDNIKSLYDIYNYYGNKYLLKYIYFKNIDLFEKKNLMISEYKYYYTYENIDIFNPYNKIKQPITEINLENFLDIDPSFIYDPQELSEISDTSIDPTKKEYIDKYLGERKNFNINLDNIKSIPIDHINQLITTQKNKFNEICNKIYFILNCHKSLISNIFLNINMFYKHLFTKKILDFYIQVKDIIKLQDGDIIDEKIENLKKFYNFVFNKNTVDLTKRNNETLGIILVEIVSGNLLSIKQKVMINKIIEDFKKNDLTVQQAIMGSGKSAMITPVICFDILMNNNFFNKNKYTDIDNLETIIITLPETLTKQTEDLFKNDFGLLLEFFNIQNKTDTNYIYINFTYKVNLVEKKNLIYKKKEYNSNIIIISDTILKYIYLDFIIKNYSQLEEKKERRRSLKETLAKDPKYIQRREQRESILLADEINLEYKLPEIYFGSDSPRRGEEQKKSIKERIASLQTLEDIYYNSEDLHGHYHKITYEQLEELEELEEKQHLEKIPKLFNMEKTFFIFDEFDSIYNPLNSDFNRPDNKTKQKFINMKELFIDMDFLIDLIHKIIENPKDIITNLSMLIKNKYQNLKEIDLKSIQDFVIYIKSKDSFLLYKETNNNSNENFKNDLKVFKLLTTLIDFFNGQIYNKNFGLPTKKSHKEQYVAVPYTAANSPSNGSNFSDIDIKLLATIYCFINNGIRRVDKLNIINYIYKQIKQSKKIYFLQNTKDDFFLKDTNLSYKDFFNIYESKKERLLNIIVPSSKEKNYEFIKYYLLNFIIPNIEINLEFNNMSAIEIISSNLSKYKTGFSGTIQYVQPYYNEPESETVYSSNILSDMLEQTAGFRETSDEKEFRIIGKNDIDMGGIYLSYYGYPKQNKVINIDFTKSNERTEIVILNEIITNHINSNPEINSLIDAAGIFVNNSIEDIIKILSEKTAFKKIIYKNSNNEIKIYENKINTNYDKQIYEDAFIYYGNKHIVGTDIKQTATMTGLLTINKTSIETKVAQAIFRLRNTNNGHNITFLVDDTLNLTTPQQVLDYVIKTEEIQKYTNIEYKKLKQNINYAIRDSSKCKSYKNKSYKNKFKIKLYNYYQIINNYADIDKSRYNEIIKNNKLVEIDYIKNHITNLCDENSESGHLNYLINELEKISKYTNNDSITVEAEAEAEADAEAEAETETETEQHKFIHTNIGKLNILKNYKKINNSNHTNIERYLDGNYPYIETIKSSNLELSIETFTNKIIWKILYNLKIILSPYLFFVIRQLGKRDSKINSFNLYYIQSIKNSEYKSIIISSSEKNFLFSHKKKLNTLGYNFAIKSNTGKILYRTKNFIKEYKKLYVLKNTEIITQIFCNRNIFNLNTIIKIINYNINKSYIKKEINYFLTIKDLLTIKKYLDLELFYYNNINNKFNDLITKINVYNIDDIYNDNKLDFISIITNIILVNVSPIADKMFHKIKENIYTNEIANMKYLLKLDIDINDSIICIKIIRYYLNKLKELNKHKCTNLSKKECNKCGCLKYLTETKCICEIDNKLKEILKKKHNNNIEQIDSIIFSDEHPYLYINNTTSEIYKFNIEYINKLKKETFKKLLETQFSEINLDTFDFTIYTIDSIKQYINNRKTQIELIESYSTYTFFSKYMENYINELDLDNLNSIIKYLQAANYFKEQGIIDIDVKSLEDIYIKNPELYIEVYKKEKETERLQAKKEEEDRIQAERLQAKKEEEDRIQAKEEYRKQADRFQAEQESIKEYIIASGVSLDNWDGTTKIDAHYYIYKSKLLDLLSLNDDEFDYIEITNEIEKEKEPLKIINSYIENVTKLISINNLDDDDENDSILDYNKEDIYDRYFNNRFNLTLKELTDDYKKIESIINNINEKGIINYMVDLYSSLIDIIKQFLQEILIDITNIELDLNKNIIIDYNGSRPKEKLKILKEKLKELNTQENYGSLCQNKILIKTKQNNKIIILNFFCINILNKDIDIIKEKLKEMGYISK